MSWSGFVGAEWVNALAPNPNSEKDTPVHAKLARPDMHPNRSHHDHDRRPVYQVNSNTGAVYVPVPSQTDPGLPAYPHVR